jgi:hypothetical protein
MKVMPVVTLTMIDLVRLAKLDQVRFVAVNLNVARIVSTSDVCAIIDMTKFPDYMELRTAQPSESLSIALSNDFNALLQFAQEHEIIVVDEEDQCELVNWALTKTDQSPFFTTVEQEAMMDDTSSPHWPDDLTDPPPADLESAFGGHPTDYELLPPIPDHGDCDG